MGPRMVKLASKSLAKLPPRLNPYVRAPERDVHLVGEPSGPVCSAGRARSSRAATAVSQLVSGLRDERVRWAGVPE